MSVAVNGNRPTESRQAEQEPPLSWSSRVWRRATSDVGMLILLALARLLLHTIVSGQYGFHRDELQTFNNARHLWWGYAEYPPMTAFLARVELVLFGTSLRSFRFFAATAQAIAMLLAGLAAREMGGKREAQVVAALAVCVGGHTLFLGSFLSYTSLDYMWWMVVAYFVIRLVKSDDPRWWLAIGAAVGLGLLTKYSIGFLGLGIIGGVLLTPVRRQLKSPWLWCGALVALLIVLPNALWQMRHQFATFEYLKSIHARDIQWGRTNHFLLNQMWTVASPVTVPLWLAGLRYVFRDPNGKRYRMIGWMYVIPLIAFFVANGRDYYMAPSYPMLLAAGAVWGEQWVASLSTHSAGMARSNTWWTLACSGAFVAAVTLPIAPLYSGWWRFAEHTNGNFHYEVGYQGMVQNVAKVRDSLPATQRASLGILLNDDGEAGAVNLYGAAYGLPPAISGMNSNWLRGYGDPPPETVITVGVGRDFLEQNFESCQLFNREAYEYAIHDDGTPRYTEMYVCSHLRKPWPEFWSHFRYYG